MDRKALPKPKKQIPPSSSSPVDGCITKDLSPKIDATVVKPSAAGDATALGVQNLAGKISDKSASDTASKVGGLLSEVVRLYLLGKQEANVQVVPFFRN